MQPGTILVSAVIILGFILVACAAVFFYYAGKVRQMKKELCECRKESERLSYDLSYFHQKLKQQHDRYSLLLEKMLNGFFIFEPVMNSENKLIDMRFVYVNPGFKNQIALKTENILGNTWLGVFGYPNINLGIYQRILKTGEADRFETHYAHSGVYYLVNAFKVSENQIGVIFDNITEYKTAIKEIRTLNEELEQRVASRTMELQGAVNELEAFTYTVSHDLKAPFRAVDGYSRIILEDHGAKLGEEVVEMILGIRTVCRDMIEMIDKLLQYSHTSRAVLSKEEIDSGEMFPAIFHELKSACPGREIKLIVETGLPKVQADRVLLKQAIYNILSNAVKFTKGRDTAVITVGNTITENEYVFYVRDNGVGFDMEFSGKLFGIFQRLHTGDEFEGTGIGLVTVRKVIQKHGGRAWIEGKVDQGATVYFTLPFSWQD